MLWLERSFIRSYKLMDWIFDGSYPFSSGLFARRNCSLPNLKQGVRERAESLPVVNCAAMQSSEKYIKPWHREILLSSWNLNGYIKRFHRQTHLVYQKAVINSSTENHCPLAFIWAAITLALRPQTQRKLFDFNRLIEGLILQLGSPTLSAVPSLASSGGSLRSNHHLRRFKQTGPWKLPLRQSAAWKTWPPHPCCTWVKECHKNLAI